MKRVLLQISLVTAVVSFTGYNNTLYSAFLESDKIELLDDDNSNYQSTVFENELSYECDFLPKISSNHFLTTRHAETCYNVLLKSLINHNAQTVLSYKQTLAFSVFILKLTSLPVNEKDIH
ncbi:MAG: hypothetical protein HKO66_04780 [Saprospiraceae bacterium]|nr:hypothetical protein [Bacteroidia bacterium]NNL91526.1 hypothetical protein [Saprospiraceae bacterium]